MEALRTFSITLVSANNLPDIRMFGRMKVYAKVAVTFNGRLRNTSVDYVHEKNPIWNEQFDFIVRESHIATDERLKVMISLFCRKHVGSGDKLIGNVSLPVRALFKDLSSAMPLTFNVPGTRNGTLTIRYSFGNTFLGTPPLLVDSALASARVNVAGMIEKGRHRSIGELMGSPRSVAVAQVMLKVVDGLKEVVMKMR